MTSDPLATAQPQSTESAPRPLNERLRDIDLSELRHAAADDLERGFGNSFDNGFDNIGY